MWRRLSVFGVIGFACLLFLYPQSVVFADQTIGRLTIKDGSAVLYPGSSNLNSAILAKEIDLGKGIVCKANSEIVLFRNGEWEKCWLKGPVTLTFAPEKVVVLKADTLLTRYSNGHPASGTTANGTNVKGLPIKADSPITFHTRGAIASFVLASDFKYGQITWKKDTQLSFYPNGNLQEGTPARDFPMGNTVLKAGLRSSFTESGGAIRLNY